MFLFLAVFSCCGYNSCCWYSKINALAIEWGAREKAYKKNGKIIDWKRANEKKETELHLMYFSIKLNNKRHTMYTCS